jgi:hypothetical protein
VDAAEDKQMQLVIHKNCILDHLVVLLKPTVRHKGVIKDVWQWSVASTVVRFKQQDNLHLHNFFNLNEWEKTIKNKKLTGATVNGNEQSENGSWWTNELDSLGIKTSGSSNKSELKNSQELEDLTDDLKQAFIHDYKTCYRDKMQKWKDCHKMSIEVLTSTNSTIIILAITIKLDFIKKLKKPLLVGMSSQA